MACYGIVQAMTRGTRVVIAGIIMLLLGLSLLAAGARELLLPSLMQDYVTQMRVGAMHQDYSLVQKLGIFVLAAGALLMTFCWYLRIRGFWFVVSLGILIYGVTYYLSPEQCLEVLKRIYLGDPLNQKIAAGIKMLGGAALIASLRFSE